MSTSLLVCLGMFAGAGAGLLAGLIGIGGRIVIVPIVYYGPTTAGVSANEAAHMAVFTISLAAIMPTAIVSSFVHRRAGNTDFAFFRDWGPGIALGVIGAQLVAPYLSGNLLTGVFALFCLVVAGRFAVPHWFEPLAHQAGK